MITLNTVLAILQSVLRIIEMTMEAQPPEQRAIGVARLDKVVNTFVDLIERFKDKVDG